MRAPLIRFEYALSRMFLVHVKSYLPLNRDYLPSLVAQRNLIVIDRIGTPLLLVSEKGTLSVNGHYGEGSA